MPTLRAVRVNLVVARLTNLDGLDAVVDGLIHAVRIVLLFEGSFVNAVAMVSVGTVLPCLAAACQNHSVKRHLCTSLQGHPTMPFGVACDHLCFV